MKNGTLVTWTDPGEKQTTLLAEIVRFIPKGSPCGFSTSSTDVWELKLKESHTNGVRHLVGEKVFATSTDFKAV